MTNTIPGYFNGRMPVLHTGDGGSNPSLGTISINSIMKILEITDAEALEKLKQKKLKKAEIRKKNPKPFDSSTTDMPHYDRMMKDPEVAQHQGFEVYHVYIRPQDYISACADGFKTSMNSLEQSRTDSGKVDKYAEMLLTGTTFPMPVIQYTQDGGFTQEGLHRSFAAKKVGIEKIPVLVVKEIP